MTDNDNPTFEDADARIKAWLVYKAQGRTVESYELKCCLVVYEALQDALMANTALESAILAKNAEIDRLKGRITALDKELAELRGTTVYTTIRGPTGAL